MIGVTGQYLATFSIGPLNDFVDEIEYFEIRSAAGGTAPTFALTFSTYDEEVLRYLHEGYPLNIASGRTLDELVKTRWRIGYPNFSASGDSMYKIQLKGVLDIRGHMHTSQTGIYTGTSEDVIKARASASGLTPDMNTVANDSMNWIQAGVSDWTFIQDTYLRYWGDGKSCAAVAITHEHELRMYDLRAHIDSHRTVATVDWVVESGAGQVEDNMLVPSGGMSVTGGNMFMNKWAGAGNSRQAYNPTEADSMGSSSTDNLYSGSDISPDDSLFLSHQGGNQRANLEPDIGDRSGRFEMVIPENVHGHWNESYINNTTRLARASSNTLQFHYHDALRNIKPLDVVQVQSLELSKTGNPTIFSKLQSGLYIVDTHVVAWSNNSLAGAVTLTRDAAGDLG